MLLCSALSRAETDNFQFSFSSDISFDTSRSIELLIGFAGETNEFQPQAQRFLRGERLDAHGLDRAVKWFMWTCSFPDAEKAVLELLKVDASSTNELLAGLVYVVRGDYVTARSRLAKAEDEGHPQARFFRRYLALLFKADVEDMLPELIKEAAAKDLGERELNILLGFALRSQANGSTVLKALHERPDIKQLLRDNPTAMRMYFHSCRLRNVKSIIEDPDGKASG